MAAQGTRYSAPFSRTFFATVGVLEPPNDK
jgi:hypothetical protein